MRWISTISREAGFDAAVDEACARLVSAGNERAPDLVLAFASPHHRERWDELGRAVRRTLGDVALAGCTAAGVVGGGFEVEHGPALGLMAATLPGVECSPVRIDPAVARRPELGSLVRQPGLGGPAPAALLVFADPFSTDISPLLPALDELWPATVKVGGMASGQARPHGNRLYLNDEAHDGGVVGLALRGRLEVEGIVAQGCRPIGSPMFVTSHDGIRIFGLDGKKPLTVLESLVASLGPRERALAQRALFIGMAPRADLERYETGDFLVRNVIGIEPPTGALAVGGECRDGMVVQFHLRDAETSAEELDLLLARRARAGVDRLRGALLFSCLGRGAALYGDEGHDSAALRGHLGTCPVGGFFCNGEIGPIHGETHLHGYSSAIALFSDPPTQ